MNSSDLRSQFRAFAGEERYREFVHTVCRVCRGKGRLMYWQEQLWDKFLAQSPTTKLATHEIIETFTFCYLHDCELLEATAPLPEVRDTPELSAALRQDFPFAANSGLMCQDCRSAFESWVQVNMELCRILRCRTTYEEFWHRHVGETFDRSIEAAIKKRAREIAAEMKPGDELWEWDEGGWQSFSGRAGIAVVRNGQIIKRWCEFKS